MRKEWSDRREKKETSERVKAPDSEPSIHASAALTHIDHSSSFLVPSLYFAHRHPHLLSPEMSFFLLFLSFLEHTYLFSSSNSFLYVSQQLLHRVMRALIFDPVASSLFTFYSCIISFHFILSTVCFPSFPPFSTLLSLHPIKYRDDWVIRLLTNERGSKATDMAFRCVEMYFTNSPRVGVEIDMENPDEELNIYKASDSVSWIHSHVSLSLFRNALRMTWFRHEKARDGVRHRMTQRKAMMRDSSSICELMLIMSSCQSPVSPEKKMLKWISAFHL